MATEKELLLAEAKELGLEFAKNAQIKHIKDQIDAAKSEVYEKEEPYIEEAEQAMTESQIRADIEAEYAAKLKIEKARMAAAMETNMATKSKDALENRVTIGQAKLKARRDAMELKRVHITCKDPMKSSWEGEIISAGNDVIGEVKKYVMFDTENGYHVPQIVLNVLKDKVCTIFVNKKVNGQMVKKAKQIKAYSIDYLQPLTEKELEVLALDQSARHSID